MKTNKTPLKTKPVFTAMSHAVDHELKFQKFTSRVIVGLYAANLAGGLPSDPRNKAFDFAWSALWCRDLESQFRQSLETGRKIARRSRPKRKVKSIR